MNRSATNGWIADTLSKEGSLWFESAFCKRFNQGALLFSEPVEVIKLVSLSSLQDFFKVLEQKLDEGYFLGGWLSYEVGYGFEQTLFHADAAKLPPSPLGWFGVYRNPEHVSERELEQLFSEQVSVHPCALSFSLSEQEYAEKIAILSGEIAAGNVYQVNFTGRYRFTLPCPALDLFCAMRSAQPSSYTAYLNCGERTILSFSPELFFTRCGSVIETMPMKGTAPRGYGFEEDNGLREGLARCTKNLAENLMIVDLLRNDLGRICKPGSVEATSLFATETYPTLHQMVSTIQGELREDVVLYDLFKALYPCGSITGAPKIKAMSLIQELEQQPRGIYTGTIGFITPNRDMVFNVAIRTAELSGQEGVYGTGSGIVWDSDVHDEYRECQLKAKILVDASMQHVELFESILWSGSYVWLQDHLERITSSAQVLGFPCEKKSAVIILTNLEKDLRQSGKRFKVRLSLSCKGVFSVGYEALEVLNSVVPVKLCLAADRTDSSQPLLYHKTTSRELYDRYYALARKKGYEEVLFLNEQGEITEGAISNIFIRKGPHFYTPPSDSGLLKGIYRQYFLATRPLATEKTLTLQDVTGADMIYIANSVRGLRPAIFNGYQIML